LANIVFTEHFAGYGTGVAVTTKWTVTGGSSMTITTAFGGQALRWANGGQSGYMYRQWGTPISEGTVYFHHKVDLISGATPRPTTFLMSDAAFMFGIEWLASGVIKLYSMTSHNAGTVLATSDVDKWTFAAEHACELEFVISDTVGRLSLYIDGALAVEAVNVDTKPSTQTTVNKICEGLGSNNGYIGIIGHIVVNDSPVREGPKKFYIIRPNADTADKDWTASTGSDNFAMVDEVGVSITDYVEGDTAGDLDLYEFENLTITPESIDLVQCFMDAWKTDLTARTLAPVVDVAGAQLEGDDFALGATAGLFVHDFYTKPAGGEWDPSSIAGIKAGPLITAP
jgi:hypothetical protein